MNNILLMGSGALAVDLLDMFGSEAFAGAYVDAGYELTGLGELPRCHDLADSARRGQRYLLAVADSAQRLRFSEVAEAAGLRPCEPMVSVHAVVAQSARLDAGVVVAHFAVVGPAARLMSHVLVMHNAVIGHDSVLHHNCVICAGASIAGGVHVGAGSFVGPNAVIAPKVRIAAGSFLSAGTACLRHVDEPSVLIGNPARRVTADR
jgi:sugar O-acyltransferase (sialic acid O-acetyltransferase NeuD family)